MTEIGKLTPPNTLTTAGFGTHVAMDGGIAIISHKYAEADAFNTATGGLIGTFTSNASFPFSGVGVSVAIDAGQYVIGDINVGLGGEAYLLSTNTGNVLNTFTPPPLFAHEFGSAVGITGNTILIGDILAGKVYQYDAVTGNLIHELAPTIPISLTSYFGHAIAVDGQYAIVGARFDKDELSNTVGAAYVFDLTTGQQIAKLSPPANSEPKSNFGFSVGINGNTAIVGSTAGQALLYNIATGNLTQTLTPSGSGDHSLFGWSVAINDIYTAVGSPTDNATSSSSQEGAAYLFDVTTGGLVEKFTGSDISAIDRFGSSMSIDGNTLIVGAPVPQGSLFGSNNPFGAAYLFTIPEPGMAAMFGLLSSTALRRRRATNVAR